MSRVCIGKKFSSISIWDGMSNLFAAIILNFEYGKASPKSKIIAAINAKLHIPPKMEKNFLPSQTLVYYLDVIFNSGFD